MARPTNRLLAAAAGALLVVGLAGCSSDDDVAASAAPSPTPSASPTPTEPVIAAPERPAKMDDTTHRGAEAAVPYFFTLDKYMQVTGDTETFVDMSHSTCQFCTERVEQAKKVASNQYTFTGGETRVEIVHTYAQDQATGIWPIDIRVREKASEITAPDGSTVFEQKANVFTARIELALRDGEWVVVELANAQAE